MENMIDAALIRSFRVHEKGARPPLPRATWPSLSPELEARSNEVERVGVESGVLPSLSYAVPALALSLLVFSALIRRANY